jgi:thioesterase domain-containing protein/acyl carrier protein
MGTINGAITSPTVGMEQPALARFGPVGSSTRGEADQRAAARRERVFADAQTDAAAADDVERELLGVCGALLGVPPGRHDNLFDLGIDSLAALRLIAQCEKRFKCQLPAATLFTAPTIAGLAEVLRERTATAAWSSLVAIQPRGSRPPFFWIHGDSTAPALAQYLGPDQPFYALEHQGQDGRPASYTEVETIAAYYLREMRRVQGTGPYYLGGFSFGGVIAFEVAQQLTRQSEKVALLAALDPSSFAGARTVPSPSPDAIDGVTRSQQHLHALAALSATERFAYIWARALPRAAAWLRWHRLVASFKRLTYRFQLAMRLPLSVFVRSLYIQDIYLAAIRHYAPRPYTGPVLLFKGQDRVYRGPLDWERLIDAASDVCVIPAGHLHMHEDQPFGMWAEKLARTLLQVQRRRPLDGTTRASTTAS